LSTTLRCLLNARGSLESDQVPRSAAYVRQPRGRNSDHPSQGFL
jgi:hypothetical protein